MNFNKNSKIIERLNKKLDEYQNNLAVSIQYNLIDDINKYTMLLDVLEYIKTGKALPKDFRKL